MLPVAVFSLSSDGVAIILCTSGFTDDVMFSYHMGPMGVSLKQNKIAWQTYKFDSAEAA